VPDLLTDEKIEGDKKMVLLPALAGALFVSQLTKLPYEKARLVWECELDTAPPATIRPRKPKMWLVAKAKLQKGNAYVLQ
jgi:hypothetical protein